MGGFGAAQWRFGPTGLGPAMPEQGSGQVRGRGRRFRVLTVAWLIA